MALTQEVQNWIDQMKSAGASEEWIKSTVTMLDGNEKLAGVARETVLAQSDYTRSMQSLKALEKQEKDELAKTVQWQKDLAKWKEGTDAEKMAAARAKETAENELAATRSRIKTLKEQGYLDDSMLDGISLTTAATGGASSVNSSAAGASTTQPDYMTRADGVNYSINSLKIADQIAQLREDHNELFRGVNDKKFSGARILDYVNEKGVKPEEAWDALYGVTPRREELREQSTQKRIQEEADKLYRQRVSQDIQAGRPVSVNAPESNMRKMSAIPDLKNQNPYQRSQARVQKAIAELESKRVPA